jgi:hypothetical protein
LPANIIPQQIVLRQGNAQQHFTQSQQIPQQQMLNNQQFATMPQSPQLRQHQFIPQQGVIMSANNPLQQTRVPHHVPQSLMPVKNIQSETFV